MVEMGKLVLNLNQIIFSKPEPDEVKSERG
jgi:hypothetical protein